MVRVFSVPPSDGPLPLRLALALFFARPIKQPSGQASNVNLKAYDELEDKIEQMRIHCFQHVAFEGPAGIETWAQIKGHALGVTRFFAGETPPPCDEIDALVVMGGPMSIHDEAQHPWLVQEKASIRKAIEERKVVIGICLGAQHLAHALGANVYPGRHKEIGWFPIQLTPQGSALELTGFLPKEFAAFHWHGETYDLPPGAIHLARSEACEQQAFLYGDRVLALQFHLESTPQSVQALIEHCADEIEAGPYLQNAAQMLSAPPNTYTRLHEAMFGILDRLPL